MTKPLLHIFLSAPASNRPYYKRDLLNLFCFPVEDRLDFAFSKKWIAGDVLTQIEGDGVKLEGQKVLLIFCELNSAINGDNIFTFHPIRFATILKTIERGDSVTFQTKLGGFVDLAKDLDNIHKLIVDSTDEHPNHARVDGKANKKAKFVRYASNNIFKTTEKTTEAWNALVDRLITMRGLSDSLFLVATDNLAQSYPQFPLGASLGTSVVHNVAKVKRGHEVSLMLYGVPGKTATFSAPKVTVSEAVARVSGPYIRQYANGYLMQYFLQIKSGWDSDRTMLRITLEAKGEQEGTMNFLSPEIAVHLDVQPPLRMLLFVVSLFFLGTLFSTVDKEMMTFIFDATKWVEAEKVKQLADISVILLKFFGSLLIGFGAFKAFRKLPGPGAG